VIIEGHLMQVGVVKFVVIPPFEDVLVLHIFWNGSEVAGKFVEGAILNRTKGW
jgi:hypothetical protein